MGSVSQTEPCKGLVDQIEPCEVQVEPCKGLVDQIEPCKGLVVSQGEPWEGLVPQGQLRERLDFNVSPTRGWCLKVNPARGRRLKERNRTFR